MKCLGIESTAHTFSIGIVSEEGTILSLVSDTYTPPEGGLKPSAVLEHHYQVFDSILDVSIHQAGISLDQLDLIAFSQGPGLGPCLRIGAVFARTLSQKLAIPLVGVNHCIAHIEIGRIKCKLDDPITLYVSGGNTLISAFESGRYQIFGETLDIPLGNMLDMVARDLDIPHPGGPVIEKLAKNGTSYINLPYIVKGMDLSYSGMYSAMRKLLKNQPHDLSSQKIHDLLYSLQETAYAMLAEVFERAIAHTEKKSVLLTGGVAANQRLQEIIQQVCNIQNSNFHVVPRNLAGDNGAMIAWTGILKYKARGADTLEISRIIPKWRMDEVEIPWRKQGSPSHFESPRSNLSPNKQLTDYEILNQIPYDGKIIRRGAEAALIRTTWHNRDALIKYRFPKSYRVSKIDNQLRSERTIAEGRALLSLSQSGFPVPIIYDIDPSQYIIIMQYLPAPRIKDKIKDMNRQDLHHTFEKIGENIAQLHALDFVHGDLTTSNIIFFSPTHVVFIDLGLTKRTIGIEEQAMDLHLFKQVLQSTHGQYFSDTYPFFLEGYKKHAISSSLSAILTRVTKIETRGRYIAKENRQTNTPNQ